MRTLAGLTTIALLWTGSGWAAHHNDVFTSGPANESVLARQVRHKLLMLPYYSIFDDLAFLLLGKMLGRKLQRASVGCVR